jgi:hypothetical protein
MGWLVVELAWLVKQRMPSNALDDNQIRHVICVQRVPPNIDVHNMLYMGYALNDHFCTHRKNLRGTMCWGDVQVKNPIEYASNVG